MSFQHMNLHYMFITNIIIIIIQTLQTMKDDIS